MSDPAPKFPAEVPEWHYLLFHPKNKVARKLVRRMQERIIDFCNEVDRLSNPYCMAESWRNCFEAGDATLVALGVMHWGQLVGHLLLKKERSYGSEVAVVVTQYKLDQAVPRAAHQALWEELQTICRDLAGAKRIFAVCPDEKVAKAHRIFHGMTTFATVMVRELEED